MSQVDLKLVIALSRTYNTVFANLEKSLKEYNISLSEFGVLELLYHKGKHPIQEVAEKILVTSGTITFVIDKLIKKGFVDRTRCTEDGRRFFVDLTKEGQLFISDLFPKHEQFLETQFCNLEKSKKEMLTNVLFELKDSINEGGSK